MHLWKVTCGCAVLLLVLDSPDLSAPLRCFHVPLPRRFRCFHRAGMIFVAISAAFLADDLVRGLLAAPWAWPSVLVVTVLRWCFFLLVLVLSLFPVPGVVHVAVLPFPLVCSPVLLISSLFPDDLEVSCQFSPRHVYLCSQVSQSIVLPWLFLFPLPPGRFSCWVFLGNLFPFLILRASSPFLPLFPVMFFLYSSFL